MLLPQSFYNRSTLQVAQELLGKKLVFRTEVGILSGRIVETEAYIGQDDPACHAAKGRTKRTEIMFGPPGIAYIYLIYGMYYCLNAVTEAADFPAAVLIRALEPLSGIDTMKKHRKQENIRQLTNGPGKICQAFGLDKNMNGADLCNSNLFIEMDKEIAPSDILKTSRIGISVGREKPWRFCIKGNPFASHPKHR